MEHKYDEKYAGPFQNLPVLIYNNDVILGQTLTLGEIDSIFYISFFLVDFFFVVSAQFLARKFDLYGQLTSTITDRAVLHGYIDGVVSCAYTDIITNILTCIWNLADFIDETKPINRMNRKIPADLQALNNLLKKSSTPFFYDQPEPTIADYFVFEAFAATRDYYEKLLPNENERQALERLETVMKERTRRSKTIFRIGSFIQTIHRFDRHDFFFDFFIRIKE